MLQSVVDVASVIKTYYVSKFAAKVKQLPWDMASNLPKQRMAQQQQQHRTAARLAAYSQSCSTPSDSGSDPGTWVPALFQYNMDAVGTNTPWLEGAASMFFTLNQNSTDDFTVGYLIHTHLGEQL